MSQYNYVVTAYESGSFKGVLNVDLFGDGISRILAIRSKSIEIYEVNKDLVFADEKFLEGEILDLPVLNKVGKVETYKDVIEIDKWRPKNQNFDDVLIFTREHELILLRAYLLESGSEKILYFSMLDQVSLYRDNLRKSQLIKMMVHSEKNRIVVLAYEGCLQVVGCELSSKEEENKTTFMSPLILRLSELTITDICLVNTTNERSLLGVLYDSGYSNDPRLIKIIELPIDLRKWTYNTNIGHVLQHNVFKITPLFYRSKRQKMVKGFFLFGDGIVEYRSIEEIMPNKNKNQDSNINSQIITTRFNSSALSGMDIGLSSLSITDVLNLDDGSRWLILDNLGRLFIMIVEYEQNDTDKVIDIRLNMLNRYSPFSRIIDLGDDFFFLASKLSDSLLLYSKNNQFYILSSLPNIGPIRDLLFSNIDRKYETKCETIPHQISKKDPLPLIAACGFGSEGALKSICNGIGLQNLYINSDSFVGQITKIFSFSSNSDKVVVTGSNYSSCFKITWNHEKANDSIDNYNSANYFDGLNKENPSQSNGRNSIQLKPKKYFISLENFDLEGFEKNEETIKLCLIGDKYAFQVTPSGLFSIGESNSPQKKWFLRDHLPPVADSSLEYIEKFDFCQKNQLVAICTCTGLLLLYELDDQNILSLVCFRTKTELFEQISLDLETNISTQESKDLKNENDILNNSISKAIDEICILGLFSIDNYILIFVGTWLNGSKLSCLYYDKQKSGTNSNIELLLNIETEFREYETMVTTLKVFELERIVETQSQKLLEEEFIGVIIGTNNGYLQLQYISKDTIRMLIDNKQENTKLKNNYQFSHYNTWKVSNSFISDIYELNISENLNRHFFICCDQPKVLFWSYNSGKGKHGLGVWSFFNIYSPWIPLVCQIKLPPKPQTKQELAKKDNYLMKTCILYINHEEKDINEIHIDELANQNLETMDGIQISRKSSQQRSIKIGLVDTLQRYNYRNIPLEFTPEKVCFVQDINMFVVVGVKERYKSNRSSVLKPILEPRISDKNEKEVNKQSELTFVETVICLVSAKDMKIHYYKSIEVNTYPTCLEYVTLRASNDENEVRSFLAVGTSRVDLNLGQNLSSSSASENYGKITLYTIINNSNSYTLLESAVYETEVAPFVIKEFKMSQLLISIENSLICLELHIFKNLTESSSSSSSSSSGIWMDTEMDLNLINFELKRKETYCTHTMIVFIKIWNEEYILVGDLMRSVGLWEFDRYTGKFHEVCRDNSIAWVVEGLFLTKDMYLISDENRNLRVLMRSTNPENDEANTSLSCIAHFHIGESATTFQKGKFNQTYPETRKNAGQDCLEESPGRLMFDEQIAFGTSQGGIYLLFSIKENPRIFSQLVLIEEAIIKTLKNSNMGIKLSNKVCNLKESELRKLFLRSSNSTLFTGIVGVLGGKNYSPLRWELNSTKESYNFEYNCSGTPRGFVCGDTIELFLDFSLDLQKSVFKELNSFKSSKKLKLPENVNQLETLIEQLKNMH